VKKQPPKEKRVGVADPKGDLLRVVKEKENLGGPLRLSFGDVSGVRYIRVFERKGARKQLESGGRI